MCSLVLLFAVIAVGRNMADNRGQETGITPGTTTTPQETTPEELLEQQTTSASTETEGQKTSEEETTSAAPVTIEEATRVLRCGKVRPLYPRDQRDAYVIFALKNRYTIDKLNDLLFESGEKVFE